MQITTRLEFDAGHRIAELAARFNTGDAKLNLVNLNVTRLAHLPSCWAFRRAARAQVSSGFHKYLYIGF